MEQNKKDILRKAIIQKVQERIKGHDVDLMEVDEETPEETPVDTPEETPVDTPEEEPIDVPKDEPITFESNPLEYILQTYPSLNRTIEDLMTPDFRNYVTGIYIIAPKPTTFKVVLHNNQSFYMKFMGKTYEIKAGGRRYYLLNLGEFENAVEKIATLLSIGSPKPIEAVGTEISAEAPAPEASVGGETTPEVAPETPAPGEGEGEPGSLALPGEEEAPLAEQKRRRSVIKEIKQRIINKVMEQRTNEAVSAAHIKDGDTFTVASGMGNFSKGDKVTVTKIEAYGNDIRIYMTSDSGVKDFIIVDKNDDSIDLDID
jgi:hypothetical protein